MGLFDLDHAPDTPKSLRVAFLTSARLMRPASGIATFGRSLAKLVEENDGIFEVHMADDKFDFADKYDGDYIFHGCRVKPKLKLPGLFGTQDVEYDQVEEFRVIIDRLLQGDKLYDCIICNGPEAARAAYSFRGFAKAHNIISVTHHSSMFAAKDVPFTDDMILECNVRQTWFDNVVTVTQTTGNRDFLVSSGANGANIEVAPLFIERTLDEEPDHQEGVLFIGTCEKRKGVKHYIDYLKKTGLPAKVLCGGRRAPGKWEETFKEAGITNYVIGKDLLGDDKIRFIRSAKMGFAASTNESFGYLVLEMAYYLPTLVVGEEAWMNFWEPYVYRAPNVDVAVNMDIIDNEGRRLRLRQDDDLWRKRWYKLIRGEPRHFNPSIKSAVAVKNSTGLTPHQLRKKMNVDSLTPPDYSVILHGYTKKHFKNETVIIP